jgi:hypothetical protein
MTTTTAPHLRDMLQREADAFSALSGSALLAQIIVKHGVYGRGIKHDLPMGTPKECYSNAAHLALDGPYRYVEGYAMRDSLCIPIHHAWVLDEDGKVIDTTWQRPEDCQYLGVRIARDALRRELLKNGVYGVLAPNEMLNVDLLRVLDPDLVAAAIRSADRRGKHHHG